VGGYIPHSDLQMQLLGVRLLTAFWRYDMVAGSTYMHQLDAFVPALHDLAVKPQGDSPAQVRCALPRAELCGLSGLC